MRATQRLLVTGANEGIAHGLSTACANALTLFLARENPALRINACSPGFIETDLTRPYAVAHRMPAPER